MALSFNINNAGPLAQITLEIISLRTAIHLATGAYGWYKSYERSKSLTHLLSVSGGELVATSSFNREVYKENREHHGMMQGVAVQNGAVQSTPLPKASTAIPDHPGTACLRALTTGILCFYGLDASVSILQDLIPFALVQYNQEDSKLDNSGPLLASLRQWVSSVAVEEDSNTFRDHLREQEAFYVERLNGPSLSDIFSLDNPLINELPLVVGALRWILTPAHKRPFKQYPTRSLRVWTVAVVMEKLGFDILAASSVISNTSEYKHLMNDAPRKFRESSSVFLVVAGIDDTDPWMLNESPSVRNSELRPQLTPVRGIPWLAFRHLRGQDRDVNTQYLADVWSYAYRSASKSIGSFEVTKTLLKIKLVNQDWQTTSSHHSSLLTTFSANLACICGPAMRQFIPMSSLATGWDPVKLGEQLDRLSGTLEEQTDLDEDIRENCYMLISIILGTLYGVCSRFCKDEGRQMSEDSEIAFKADIVFSARLKYWARQIEFALKPGADLDQWREIVYEMHLGHDNPTSLQSTSTYINRQEPEEKRLLLGAQANGMVAISELLVSLTVQPEALFCFHIKRGQILNLPLTDDGYIQASSHLENSLTMHLNPEPEVTLLSRAYEVRADATMRLDVEPCWEADPRTVVFRVRKNGIIIAPLNIQLVLDKMFFEKLSCKCPGPIAEVTVPVNERWQYVSIDQLMRLKLPGVSYNRADINYAGNKVLIDARESSAAMTFVLGIVDSRLVIIADCLECAYKHASRNATLRDDGIAIIVPWQGEGTTLR